MHTIESFAKQFPRKTHHQGVKLFTSEESSFFLYLIEGSIRMSQIGEHGQTVNLHVFQPGACLPLLSLVGPNDSYDFEAVTNIEVYQIPKEEFLAEVHANASFTYELLIHAMQGMRGLLYRIQHTAAVPAYERVAGILVYFARHQNPIEITHQEISEWLGLTRENITLQLQRLENENLIKKHSKRIEILDLEKLKTVSA